MESLPKHLQKYIVSQNYERYTPVDQAVWRYILRQLKDFLSKNAHECYLEGLEKTGIEVESIPRIENISAKLEKFGWRALPVSGFIPPAAFMELQSLGVLPIASDMRTLEHLMYTPAPDIVHEAAGHAPILVQPEFAEYLRQYSQVAKKAIISKEDLDVYEAIRILSDAKENPLSTKQDIEKAEQNLNSVVAAVSHVSEAAELGRMNWWTAEYGLIGSIDNPKIFGAGLLSSKGESKWCLSQNVKKIPLSVECLKHSYDITEPQPQLFVTPDFKTLVTVLHEMANTMAFKVGGIHGLNKAIKAESVNTVVMDTGVQVSGVLTEYILDQQGELAFLKFNGPSQISFADMQLDGHSKSFHQHGFSSPVGRLKGNFAIPNEGASVEIQFESGIVLNGKYKSSVTKSSNLILLSFTDCKVTLQDRMLFDPSWGQFDMILGNKVTSVFGGPADRNAYGEVRDFVAARVPAPKFSEKDLKRHQLYAEIRNLREQKKSESGLADKIKAILDSAKLVGVDDWLLNLEALELLNHLDPKNAMTLELNAKLKSFANENSQSKEVIEDGLKLAMNL